MKALRPARVLALALVSLTALGLVFLHFSLGGDSVSVPSGARAGQLKLHPAWRRWLARLDHPRPHALLGGHLWLEAAEDGKAQQATAIPLAELDVDDGGRLHPVDPIVGPARIVRRRCRREPVKDFSESDRGGSVEP